MTKHLPLAVVFLAVVNLGLRPTWESIGALLIAATLFAVQEYADAKRAIVAVTREHELVVAAYGVEVQALRAELKTVGDAVRSVTSAQTVARRVF